MRPRCYKFVTYSWQSDCDVFVTKRGFRVVSPMSVLLQSSYVTALMKGYYWPNNLMSAMRHLWCYTTYRGLPITPSLVCSVSLCALDLNPVWPHPVSLSLHVTDQFSRPPSPPHVTVTGPGTRGLRRFKWPPPPPLLSSDLGSNRHCAAHNFWRELFLPLENLLNTLNRLNKKHSPTILFLHPVYLLYLPGNIKHSNPLFLWFPWQINEIFSHWEIVSVVARAAWVREWADRKNENSLQGTRPTV